MPLRRATRHKRAGHGEKSTQHPSEAPLEPVFFRTKDDPTPQLMLQTFDDYRAETSAIFQKLYATNEANIAAASTGNVAALKTYRETFNQEFSGIGYAALPRLGFQEFFDVLSGHQAVVLGNYQSVDETLLVAQDILAAALNAGRKPIYYSDLSTPKQQATVDAALSAKGDTARAVELLCDNWPYKNAAVLTAFLAFLKSNGIPLIGCDQPNASLAKYGTGFSLALGKHLASANPNQKTFVLATLGQYHLAQKNAFATLEKEIRGAFKGASTLRIIQNIHECFYALNEGAEPEGINILRLSEQTLLLSYMPPNLIQNTYLNWSRREPCVYLNSFAIYEGFVEIMQRLKREFSIDFILNEDKIRVYSFRDLNLLGELRKLKFTEADLRFVVEHIENGQSLYIKKRNNNVIFLANILKTHVAEEATHFLKQNFIKGRTQRSPADDFYFHILHEMIGFFGSKLICPERSAPTFDDFFAMSDEELRDDGVSEADQKVAEFIVGYFKGGNITPLENHVVEQFSPEVFNGIVHGIGYIMGNYLYNNYTKEIVNKDFIKDIMINEYKKERCYRLFVDVLQRMKQIEYI